MAMTARQLLSWVKRFFWLALFLSPTGALAGDYFTVTKTSGVASVPFTFNSTTTLNGTAFHGTDYIIITSTTAGSNLGNKILTGINALPSTGGIVDARALSGAQSMSDFVSVAKNVTVLLGVSTITLTGTSGGNFAVFRGGNRFIGSGPGLTIFSLGTVSGTSSSALSIEANADNVELSGFTLNGGSASTAVQYGISTSGGSDYVKISNFRIEDTSATIANVFLTSGTYNTVEDFHIKALVSQNHGVRLQNYSSMDNYHTIRNGVVREGGFAFSTVLGGKIDWVNLWAIGTSTNSAEGFNLDSATKNTFTNIHAIGRGDGGFVETFNENVVGSSTGSYNTMNGGYFETTYLEGMHITCISCSYENIYVRNTGQNDAANRSGIVFDAASSSTVLRNVTVFDDQANPTHYDGIQMSASSNNNVIDGAWIQGAENQEYNDGGTNNAFFGYNAINRSFHYEAKVGIGIEAAISHLHVADGKYAQFEDNNAGAPTATDCDSDTEYGRISIDTANERLYICNGATRGWDYVALTD